MARPGLSINGQAVSWACAFQEVKLVVINVAKNQGLKPNVFSCQMLLQINIFRQNSVF